MMKPASTQTAETMPRTIRIQSVFRGKREKRFSATCPRQ
jgi:hypothetical protein